MMIGACWEDGPDHLALILELAASALDGYMGSECEKYSTESGGESKEQRNLLALEQFLTSPRAKISRGIARCMMYLHHQLLQPLIHRDLKPANILLSSDLEAKVADFGASRLQETQDAATMTMTGTIIYCAPEVLRGDRYSFKADVFSFGVMLLEIILCDPRHAHTSFFGRAGKTNSSEGWRPHIPDELKTLIPDADTLLGKCLEDDPSKRPNFIDIVSSLDIKTDTPDIDIKAEAPDADEVKEPQPPLQEDTFRGVEETAVGDGPDTFRNQGEEVSDDAA